MPQFAFDGIFAPQSTPPVRPQRPSSAAVQEDPFGLHLSQARGLPDPYPYEPGSRPDKPTPPQCTTNPVTPPDRRQPSQEEKKQNPGAAPYRTHTPQAGDGPSERSSESAKQQFESAASKNAETSGEPAPDERDDSDNVGSTWAVAQIEMALLSQNDAVAAAIAGAEPNVTTKAVGEDSAQVLSDQALINFEIAKKLTHHVEIKGVKQRIESTPAGSDSKAIVSSAHTTEANAHDVIDELSAGSTPDVTADEEAPHEARVEEATAENVPQESAPNNAQEKTSQATPVAQPGTSDSSSNQRGRTVDSKDTRRSPLEAESQKSAPETRRRDTQFTKAADVPVGAKTASQVEQPLAMGDAVPAQADTTTDSAEPMPHVAMPDRVDRLDARSDHAGQNPGEEHATPGKSQQSFDTARDNIAERTSRPAASHPREADASAPRSQLLTDLDRLRLVQRVARAMHTSVTAADVGQMRLRLSPPELGSLRLEIVVRQGTVSAHVEAETKAAREVLLDNLPALRERLAEQSIKLERFEVDLMRQSFDQASQHAGEQASDLTHRGQREERAASRETKQPIAGVAANTPVIQEGHVNVVI